MKNARKTNFTLIELMAATFVLSMVVLGLLQIFSVTQKLSSASSSKIEICSRARMALDMMATDIECLYYKEDVATLAISTKNGLSVATQRTLPVPKIEGGAISSNSCASKNTAVNYNIFKSANGDSEVDYYALKMIAVGSDDVYPNSGDDEDSQYCKINTVYTSGQIKTFEALEVANKGESDLSNLKMSTMVIDGVKSFKITFMKCENREPSDVFDLYDYSDDEQTSVYQSAVGTAAARVPDAVRIELELYDQDIMRTAQSKHADLNGIDLDTHVQKFVRIVSIDRGQRNMATQGED